MVHDQVDVPLCKELKTGSFGQNHPEYGVSLFQTAFLSALHRLIKGIHLDIAHKAKGAEVTIQPGGEDCSVCDLCFMAFSWFEMDFLLQNWFPCRKETLIKIGIHGTDRHIQFRVVCQDMIRRLSLFDQWRNDLIFFVKFLLGHVDPGSGIPEFFAIFLVSEPRVIRVFVDDGAVADLFCTAVADIRSPVKSYAALFFKVSAGLITGGQEVHLIPHRTIFSQALVFFQ